MDNMAAPQKSNGNIRTVLLAGLADVSRWDEVKA